MRLLSKENLVTPQERYVQLKTALLVNMPFFASLLIDLLTVKVGKFDFIDTAGTDGKTLWLDEDFITKELTLEEGVFVLCHEIAHVMWEHMARGKIHESRGLYGKKFDHRLYNFAADYVINDMLVKSSVGRMPKDALHDARFTGNMLVEAVYKELLDEMPPPINGPGGYSGEGDEQDGNSPGGSDGQDGNSPGESDGQGGDSPGKGRSRIGDQQTLDTHIYGESGVSEAEMKRAVASAVQQAKGMGKMPASLERFVHEVLQPKITWEEKLRLLLSTTLGRDTANWNRPHRRRLVTSKLYLPSWVGLRSGCVVWATDTSGSMRQREFDAATAEMQDILMTCRPDELWAISCDAKVHSAERLESEHDLSCSPVKMVGGGGTKFTPVFDYIEEHGIMPDVLVYFTDGYGTWPESPPGYPVIWVMSTEVKPPFGDFVRVEVNDYEQN